MALLPLTDGRYAKVDAADYNRLKHYSWQVGGKAGLSPFITTRRNGRKTTCLLSKFVYHHVVDPRDYPWRAAYLRFSNGDPMDCRRRNLTLMEDRKAFNRAAQIRRYADRLLPTGVYPTRRNKSNPFQSRIRSEGRCLHLGTFSTAEAASEAYQAKRRELERK